jgi:hypothetical protein
LGPDLYTLVDVLKPKENTDRREIDKESKKKSERENAKQAQNIRTKKEKREKIKKSRKETHIKKIVVQEERSTFPLPTV